MTASLDVSSNGKRRSATFRLFVYGLLRSDVEDERARGVMDGCELERAAQVGGTLYDLEEYPAMILAGDDTIHGEIWRCPADALERLDRYESVDQGLFRRVGLDVDGEGCWCYVAGGRLAPRLDPALRIPDGRWRNGAARSSERGLK